MHAVGREAAVRGLALIVTLYKYDNSRVCRERISSLARERLSRIAVALALCAVVAPCVGAAVAWGKRRLDQTVLNDHIVWIVYASHLGTFITLRTSNYLCDLFMKALQASFTCLATSRQSSLIFLQRRVR